LSRKHFLVTCIGHMFGKFNSYLIVGTMFEVDGRKAGQADEFRSSDEESGTGNMKGLTLHQP